MTQQEKVALLEEAKRRYPIGTQYHPVSTGTGKCTDSKYTSNRIPYWVENVICANSNIYYNGTWAEVISLPKVEYVKCVRPDVKIEVGKIYKVDKIEGKDNGYDNWVYKINNMSYYYHYFEVSTKEEYDKQNTPQFEVGKWYKVLNRDYTGYSYAKFLRTDGKYFYFSEYIGNNKHKIYSGSWRGTDEYTLLTDLSEIQQYLPDGYPDKIVDKWVDPKHLISGSIYVVEFTSEKDKHWNSIYESGGQLNLRTRLRLNGSTFNPKDSGSWAPSSYPCKFRLPTHKELSWYNACISANKVICKLEDYTISTNNTQIIRDSYKDAYGRAVINELINELTNQKTENNEHKENRSVKVQRLNIKVGTANPIRGIGLKSTGIKITLGSNNSYNQTRFSSCKARPC